MVNDFEFHYVKYDFKKKVAAIRLSAMIENNGLSMKSVYESDDIVLKSKSGNELIHEKFPFDIRIEETFLIFNIEMKVGGDKEGESPDWISIPIYMLIEDLIKETKKLIINTEYGQIKIYYDIKSKLNGSLNEYEKVDKALRKEEIPNYIQQLQIGQDFLKKITALRRLNVDVTDFVQARDLNRDIKIMIGALAFILFTKTVLAMFIMFIIFFDEKYKLRSRTVKYFKRCFINYEDTTTEFKKNMYFIKQQQLMLINLSDLLRTLFYNKNRIYMFYIFRYFIFVVIGLFLLSFGFVSVRLSLLVGIIGAVCAKYQEELKQYLQSKGIKIRPLADYKESLTMLFNIEKKICFRKKRKITKICFTFQNQRWYIGKGFTNRTLLFGELIRKS